MYVVSYYELSLRAAMEKALIFSREPVHSHPFTEAIFVKSTWKCNEVHILIFSEKMKAVLCFLENYHLEFFFGFIKY